jgi:hypothetical protein
MGKRLKCKSSGCGRVAIASAVAIVLLGLPSTVHSGERPSVGDKFAYRPLRLDFWQKVNSQIAEKRQLEILKNIVPSGLDSAKTDEWKLAIARALIAEGQPIHAQYLLATLAIESLGTRQGFEALRLLHTVAKNSSIDEMQLEDLAFDLDTKIEEPETRSMIAYFRGRALLRKGYPEWARQSVNDIVAGTSWQS